MSPRRTGPTPAGILERMAGRAETTTVELRLSWDRFNGHPDAIRVHVEPLVRAFAAVEQLRVMLTGTRGGPMGLLAEMVEELGPKIPRTQQGAQVLVSGVGRAVRHGKSKNERWQAIELRGRVSELLGARIADTPGVVADPDGQARPPSEIARRATALAVEWMAGALGATPSRAWSTTALAALGINADDFRSSDFGGWSVEIERGVGVSLEEEDET